MAANNLSQINIHPWYFEMQRAFKGKINKLNMDRTTRKVHSSSTILHYVDMKSQLSLTKSISKSMDLPSKLLKGFPENNKDHLSIR